MKDVLGQAISEYHQYISAGSRQGGKKTRPGKLWVNNKYGPREEMPVDVYFRDMEKMPELEWNALQQCKGRVLDIGAGAGSHALALQQMDTEVTALDFSPLNVSVMEARGVRHVLCQDFFTLSGQQYDTLLMMMNGIGLAGTLDGLRKFFTHARQLLLPGGQLLFDSSDIAYMYEGKPPTSGDYYGQVLYQYEYRRQQSDWFYWLFVDRKTLAKVAAEEGWDTQLLFADPFDQYLVRCVPK